jgi:hypothetical protein
MRGQRGNVIITALFVTIFLFFLSVALIYTNRQDIAMSLALEHRLRAQSASRSAALQGFSELRNTGGLSTTEYLYPHDVKARLQLAEVEATEDNPPILELRCKATSGQVNSSTTLRLRELSMASKDETGPKRALFLTDDYTVAKAIYGDFKLIDVDLKLREGDSVASYQGPLFSSRLATNGLEPLVVRDYVPIFSPVDGTVGAIGPAFIMAPKPTDETRIWMLDDNFVWKGIPNPDDLGFDVKALNPDGVTTTAQFVGREQPWTVNSLRAGAQWLWNDEQPATSGEIDMTEITGSSKDVDQSSVLSYGDVPAVSPVWGYSLRGSIAACENKVYSHAWQYLYRRYPGHPRSPPIPKDLGHQLTRWPCILVYDQSEGIWQVAWSALNERGDASSKHVPDHTVLIVNSEEEVYSRSLDTGGRLIHLQKNGFVTLGPTVPNGKSLVMYRDKPHYLDGDGIVELESGKKFGFETLPAELPEISGDLVLGSDELPPPPPSPPVGDFNESEPSAPTLLSTDNRVARTTRYGYRFTYTIPVGIRAATDGKDLWVPLLVEVEKEKPSFKYVGEKPPFEGDSQTFRTLARFDGLQWHILPHGLRPLVSGGNLGLQDNLRNLYATWYESLPDQRSRYTIVSIHHDPVDMK